MAPKDTTGDVARTAAAAPVTPTTTDTPKRNRFDGVFGAVLFKPSDNAKIFTNERNGTKSRKVAQVMIELGNTGVFVKGSIYARQSPGQSKAHAEFAWFGANMQTALAAEDVQAKSELDAYGQSVARRYGQWSKDNPEATAALRSATSTDAPEIDITL